MRIDVLGVGFDNLTMTEAVERGMELVRSPGPHYVVTPNPEIVEVCREDSGARAAVNGADLVLPGRHRRHQGRGHAGDASEGKDAGR